MATIGNLVKNYNLQGHLDISDVTIIGNRLTGEMFGVSNCKLQYFALPKSIGKMEKCIEWVDIDTLVCGCDELPDFRIGYSPVEGNFYDYCSNISNFNVKHLIIREGVKSFKAFCQDSGSSIIYKNNTLESIQFPQGIKHLSYFNYLQNLSSMNVPEGVETLGLRLHTNIHILSDTLIIPSSVKTFYDTWAGYDYRNAYTGTKERNVNGRIKCLYLPENLETFWVDALTGGAIVDIHIKCKNPPKIKNGLFYSNTIVYVPVGYMEVYKQDGRWGGATIKEEVYAERLTINAPNYLYVGDSHLFETIFTPSNTTFKDVAWISSDHSILTIEKNGTGNAHRFGEVKITAISADNSCTDNKTIRVYDHTTGVAISKNTLKLKVGERATIGARTLPIDTSDGCIIWKSEDKLVATIDENGNIKGISRGTCNITATSVDGGHTATCVVTVTQPVETLMLNNQYLTLKVGQSDKLFVQISPSSAENKNVVWSSSNDEIVAVSQDGSFTAMKSGEAWIKAVSVDNQEAKDSCKVTVIQPVTGIELSQSSCHLTQIGESFQLDATVLPEDATNKEVRWSSSNGSVCLVSKGKVVATGYGVAVVMATTADGGFLATCTVTVEDTSAINDIATDNQDEAPIYDMMGCEVQKTVKGHLYIRNGRKFIAK